ncbi:MAG: PilZ domain-containing protein [Candidatus Thiodiazotropha endolucinida]
MNEPDSKERRRFHRVLFDAPSTIIRKKITYPTTLIDISLKGALLKTPADWSGELGDEVTIEVMLNHVDTVISMHAVCAHEENQHLGVLCEKIDMESIMLLRRLIELNIADEDQLQRDLEALG